MAHVEASQVIPPLDSSIVQENMYERLQEISQKKTNLKIHLRRMMKGCQRFQKNWTLMV